MATVTRTARAKINLSLEITGRRDDGYHTLSSLVAFFDAGDIVSARPASDGVVSLEISGPFAAGLATDAPDNNSVLRAAAYLKKRFSVTAGARLHLDKRLPVASGIGGGSADAAAALHLLADLWDLPPATDLPMDEVATALGADVPVCLLARPALMRSIGEQITPLETPGTTLPAVLANPGAPLSTVAVFKAFAEAGTCLETTKLPENAFAGDTDSNHLVAYLETSRNDLAAPAEALCPAIADLLGLLRQQPGCRFARMSGSGATVFGLFSDSGTAKSAQHALQTHFPGAWTTAGNLNF